LDYDGDSFGYVTWDLNNQAGYGAHNVYATPGEKHVFTEGDGDALAGIQADRLNIGQNNLVASSFTKSSIAGGLKNTGSNSTENFIGSGCRNNITSGRASVIGGGLVNKICNNTTSCAANFIGAGANNCINTCVGCSAIVAGNNNVVCNGGVSNSIIGAGQGNVITQGSQRSSIVGGCSNRIYLSSDSTILGGRLNCICNSANCSAILGGCSNFINQHDHTYLAGNNLTSNQSNTFYTQCSHVRNHLNVGGTGNAFSSTTGRIDACNDIVAFSTSDRRLKCNIKPIENSLCKVIGVSGNTFDWKELTKEETQTIHGNTGKDVGVIAQEIEAILPEAVTTRDSGYKAVKYDKIIPLLIEAIKDLTIKVENLESKISRDT
tara:strand:+ start:589 stop:1722 length:1134 start_codon:yes stop_codon:yes gene_type:complete